MTTETRKWVEKAEGDYAAALPLRKSRKKHTREIVCFHLQQCLEKYLKARLVEADHEFPKTHDLEKLLDLVVKLEPMWEVLRPSLAEITDYVPASVAGAAAFEFSDAVSAWFIRPWLRLTFHFDIF